MSPPARPSPIECEECGGSYEPQRDGQEFCSAACRKSFNNRRAVRGAEFYDLYMVHRFERDRAKQLGVFRAINRLASKFRQEDKARRAGRRSWRRLEAVTESRLYLFAERMWTRPGR